jgi:hypothetical protein
MPGELVNHLTYVYGLQPTASRYLARGTAMGYTWLQVLRSSTCTASGRRKAVISTAEDRHAGRDLREPSFL